MQRPQKHFTLCMVMKDEQILLGLKKRGLATGWWNGFGGKIESGETELEAVKRELFEESGLIADHFEKVGINEFIFDDREEMFIVHIYKTSQFSGEPIETEEMKPQWFSIHEMPYDSMWPDDRYWMPIFFVGNKFIGKYSFHGLEKCLNHEITLVNNF